MAGGDFTGLGKRDVLRLAFMGGYPEARELAPADRQEWFKTYLDDLLTKDIQDITEIRKVDTLRKVATSLVAHSAQFIAVNELSAKAELAKVTLGIEVIETATNGVDSLGGPRSVAATYDGRDRARPSLMQIKPFNCRSNNRMWSIQGQWQKSTVERRSAVDCADRIVI